MRRVNWTTVGSVLRNRDGGPLQACIRDAINALGLRVRIHPSPYVGHYLVAVNTADKRKLRRVERILWS